MGRSIHRSDRSSHGKRGTWLAAIDAHERPLPPLGGSDHPHNALIRRAMDADMEADAELRTRYSEQAGTWNAWIGSLGSEYTRPLVAGLRHARSAGVLSDTVVEFSAGTGAGAAVSRFDKTLILCDPSYAMLSQVDAAAFPCRIVASNAALPFRPHALDFGFALNGVPNPGEFRRVLKPASSLLWAYSHDADTPVFVSFDELAATLDANYVAQRVGRGSWALFSLGLQV